MPENTPRPLFGVTPGDVVRIAPMDREMQEMVDVAARVAPNIVDRGDLHCRDYMERFIDVLMGEAAERAVLRWLREHGKYAVSAVDKSSARPDPGHDIWVSRVWEGVPRAYKASVKSSLSFYKSDMREILDQFTLATPPREVRDVNIQVYFWLDPRGQGTGGHRITVPSTANMAIIGWARERDFGTQWESYSQAESRQAPAIRLHRLIRPAVLLEMLCSEEPK